MARNDASPPIGYVDDILAGRLIPPDASQQYYYGGVIL